jgi:hypothetical protein
MINHQIYSLMELMNKFNHTFKMPHLSYKIFKIFLKACENDWKQKKLCNINYIQPIKCNNLFKM